MRAGRFAVVLLAASTCVTTACAQGAAPVSLCALISSLRLTGPGVRGWLERLGALETDTPHERLLEVGPSGAVLRTLDGGATRVVVTPELDSDLLRSDARVVLIHNHPTGRSLSTEDLTQLEKPGVSAIVAIGHDGSVYAAARGPGSAREGPCAAGCLEAVREEVLKALRVEQPLSPAQYPAESYLPHLTALVLARAGFIDYVARMAPGRRRGFDVRLWPFTRVVAAASSAGVRAFLSRPR